jgi:hypothetical protein
MTRGKILLTLIVLASAAALGWWQRGPVLAWWQVRQLTQADDANRAGRVRSISSLGEDAVGPIVSALASADESVCRNLEIGLRAIADDWALDDARTLRTVQAVRDAFSSLSLEGKKAALRFAAAAAERHEKAPPSADLSRPFEDLLTAGEADDALRPGALNLAAALVERESADSCRAMCRGFAIKGLSDKSVPTRVAAIQLACREPFRSDNELLNQVAPFLRDPDVAVRRAALLVLGPNADVVSEEQLLPLLHDAEPELQHLCEIALRSRGLSEFHVRLARLVSDVDPAVRLGVFPLLRQATDLDVDVWLRRLTLDPAPAVRAAAARVAAQEPSAGLRQRLVEMAQSDPSETVREIARFYLDRSPLRNTGN